MTERERELLARIDAGTAYQFHLDSASLWLEALLWLAALDQSPGSNQARAAGGPIAS